VKSTLVTKRAKVKVQSPTIKSTSRCHSRVASTGLRCVPTCQPLRARSVFFVDRGSSARTCTSNGAAFAEPVTPMGHNRRAVLADAITGEQQLGSDCATR